MLRPVKAKEFVGEIAEELKLDETLIDQVSSFYWKEVRECLSDLRFIKIYVHNLGCFNIKKPSLDKIIEKFQRFVNAEDKIYQPYLKAKKAMTCKNKEMLEKYKSLKEEFEIENKRRQEVYERRFNNSGDISSETLLGTV